jgi:hypothetical protein
MAKTRNEREDDERQERLEHMREQISSGELVVRQMTASERRHWEKRSAAFDAHATPEERTRRDAARRRTQNQATREQKRRDAAPSMTTPSDDAAQTSSQAPDE